MNTALKEMRYSNLVFSRHREPKVTIYGSARITEDDPNYRLAEDFAAHMVTRGWGVITGAGPGIMEAGTRGAGKENSFGVSIRLPFEAAGQPIPRGSANRQLQVLLHPEAGLRQGVPCLRHPPRRMGHPRRGVRAAHPDPDREERPPPDRPPRGPEHRLLGAADRLHPERAAEAGSDLSTRTSPCSTTPPTRSRPRSTSGTSTPTTTPSATPAGG